MKTKTSQKHNEIKVLELRLGSLGSDIDLKLFLTIPAMAPKP